MKTIDLDQLDSVTGGRLFGGQGGLFRPAGAGGGWFGGRARRLGGAAGESPCGPGGCPGSSGSAAPASGG
jgi:hypothetical protein